MEILAQELHNVELSVLQICFELALAEESIECQALEWQQMDEIHSVHWQDLAEQLGDWWLEIALISNKALFLQQDSTKCDIQPICDKHYFVQVHLGQLCWGSFAKKDSINYSEVPALLDNLQRSVQDRQFFYFLGFPEDNMRRYSEIFNLEVKLLKYHIFSYSEIQKMSYYDLLLYSSKILSEITASKNARTNIEWKFKTWLLTIILIMYLLRMLFLMRRRLIHNNNLAISKNILFHLNHSSHWTKKRS